MADFNQPENGTGRGLRRRFFYGWLGLGALFVVQVISAGTWVFSFPVFLPVLSEELGWDRAQTAAGMSIGILVLGSAAILVGRLIDRYGPRLVMTAGALIAGLSFSLLATISSRLWQFYLLYGVILGLSIAAASTMSGPVVVAKWFLKRRAMAIGIFFSAEGVGATIFAPVEYSLITHVGWQGAFLVSAFLIWGIGIPLILLFIKGVPEGIGLRPYGAPGEEGGGPSPVAGDSPSPNKLIADWTFGQAVRRPAYWMLTIPFMLWGILFMGSFTHVVAYAEDMGIASAAAVGVVSVITFCMIGSRVGLGWLGDHVDKSYLLMAGYLLQGVCLLLLLTVKDMALLYIFGVLFGLTGGGMIVIVPAAIAESFGTANFGTINGLAFFMLNVGTSLGAFLSGALFEATGSYHLAFALFAFLGFAAATVALMARPMILRAKVPL